MTKENLEEKTQEKRSSILEISKEDMEKFMNYENPAIVEYIKKLRLWRAASYQRLINNTDVFFLGAKVSYSN